MRIEIDATTVPLIVETIEEVMILKRKIGFVHLVITSIFLGGRNVTVVAKPKRVMSKDTDHHLETIIDRIIVVSDLVKKIMVATTGNALPAITRTSLSERNATGVESQSREVEDVILTDVVDSVEVEIPTDVEDVILTGVVDSVEVEIPTDVEDVILDADGKVGMVAMNALMSAIGKLVVSAQDMPIIEDHNPFVLVDIKAEIETIEVKARDSRIALS